MNIDPRGEFKGKNDDGREYFSVGLIQSDNDIWEITLENLTKEESVSICSNPNRNDCIGEARDRLMEMAKLLNSQMSDDEEDPEEGEEWKKGK